MRAKSGSGSVPAYQKIQLPFANASNLVTCGRAILSAQSESLPGFMRLA